MSEAASGIRPRGLRCPGYRFRSIRAAKLDFGLKKILQSVGDLASLSSPARKKIFVFI
jgi:hypothetical protein